MGPLCLPFFVYLPSAVRGIFTLFIVLGGGVLLKDYLNFPLIIFVIGYSCLEVMGFSLSLTYVLRLWVSPRLYLVFTLGLLITPLAYFVLCLYTNNFLALLGTFVFLPGFLFASWSFQKIRVPTPLRIREKDCPICLEVFEAQTTYAELDCPHSFHHECIIDYGLAQGGYPGELYEISCPVCRQKTNYPLVRLP